MFCTVYQLKRDGKPLDQETARAAGVRGDLWFTQKRPGGMPAVEATLYGPDGAKLLQLGGAEVRKITTMGMLIRGFCHQRSQWVPDPQVWWCEVLIDG